MKKIYTTLFKATVVVVLGAAVFTACKMQVQSSEIHSNSSAENDDVVDIDILRSYFAKRVNVSIDEVSYVKETDSFKVRGINQMSRADLTESYRINGKGVL